MVKSIHFNGIAGNQGFVHSNFSHTATLVNFHMQICTLTLLHSQMWAWILLCHFLVCPGIDYVLFIKGSRFLIIKTKTHLLQNYISGLKKKIY